MVPRYDLNIFKTVYDPYGKNRIWKMIPQEADNAGIVVFIIEGRKRQKAA